MYETPQAETHTTAIAEYKPAEAAIADIQRFKGLVVDVTTAAGLAAGKDVLRQVGDVRIALEKTRKKLKEDVLERGRLIDGEAKPLFARVAEIEEPIKAQIEAEERREEAARQAAIEAEQRRLAEEERLRKEAEARELAEARAKIAAEREALEKAQTEARREREEADRVATARIRAEEQAIRERMDAEQKERREQLAAEEARVKAERDRVEAERRKVEDAQRKAREEEEAKAAAERRAKEDAERKVREEQEAVEREEKRQAAEQLDAVAMLDTFVERFGHLKRFGPVVRAIKALPAAKPAKKAA